jgi:mono/diheme cytochrome c family protein
MRAIGLILLIIFGITLTTGADAADTKKGETLAKRWCATCHITSFNQQQGAAEAPPFSAIANKPNFNERTIAYFLLAPHPRMPDMSLSRSEAADLAAYIALQK